MLREVYVDGYRSLIDFSVQLKEGLNVIVGPNGTGKSNFISFLDFVGELLSSGLNSAIATTQGAGSVFSQEKFSSDAAELTFVLSGRTDTGRLKGRYYWGPVDEPLQHGSYGYECRLRYDRSVPAIYIAYERLVIHLDDHRPLSFERFTERTEGKFSTAVKTDPVKHTISNTMFRWARQKNETSTVADYLSKVTGPDSSIIQRLLTEHAFLSAAILDITSYRSINIEPSLARKSSPVGTASDIQPTGEGLAAVLYRLERGTYNPLGYVRPFSAHKDPEEQKKIFQSIMSWCREVNPHIRRAEVQLDFHEAQLRPVMVFGYPGGDSEFPFRRVSDGTIKWLALVTILFSEDSLSVIEEPENFLHPFMQEVFIALCRKVLEAEPSRSLIISTHSPTLLDCCSPSELSIFEMQDGRTVASSVENAEELNETISRSRFGLGYFYKTGGVYGADRSPS